MSHLQEYADVFTSSDDYAKRFSGETGQWLISRQTKILKELFFDLDTSSILDVAGGHGQIANPFAEYYDVTVLGSTEECRRQIQAAQASIKIKYDAGDIENLKYEDKSFDTVTCLRYISHTDNWKTVLKELCRVAKKAVIIDFPPLISFNIMTPVFYKLKKKVEGNTRTYSIFTSREIIEEFKKNGYVLKKYNAQFFFPMFLHRMINNPNISSMLEYLPKTTGLTDIFGSPAIVCFVRDLPI